MTNPHNLSDKNNRISWSNDEIQKIWIDYVYNRLEEQFEVIILSGNPEQTNSINSSTQEFEKNNDNRYYFVRVRPVESVGLIIPSPFDSKMSVSDAKKIINMHPIADVNVNSVVHPPAHGDIYLCKYNTKNKLSFSLIKRIRSTNYKVNTFADSSVDIRFGSQVPSLLKEEQETPRPESEAPPAPRPRGPSVDNTKYTVDSSRFFIFGDSQAQNTGMGQTLRDYILAENSKATVNSISNKTYVYQGRPVKYYADQSQMGKFYFFIRKRKPETIYIFLGGNPSGGDPQADYDNTKILIGNLRRFSKESNIIWIGPPPPANHSPLRKRAVPAYTGPYEEVPWTEVKAKTSTFYRGDYIHRKAKSDAIKQAIGEIGDAKLQYIDLYALPLLQRQDDGIFGEPYGNPQFTEDGIHVKGPLRTQVLQEAKIIK